MTAPALSPSALPLRARIARREADRTRAAEARAAKARRRTAVQPLRLTVSRVLSLLAYPIGLAAIVVWFATDIGPDTRPYLLASVGSAMLAQLGIVVLSFLRPARMLQRPDAAMDERERLLRDRAKAMAFNIVLGAMALLFLGLFITLAPTVMASGTLPEIGSAKILFPMMWALVAMNALPAAILAWITPPEEPTDEPDLPERT